MTVVESCSPASRFASGDKTDSMSLVDAVTAAAEPALALVRPVTAWFTGGIDWMLSFEAFWLGPGLTRLVRRRLQRERGSTGRWMMHGRACGDVTEAHKSTGNRRPNISCRRPLSTGGRSVDHDSPGNCPVPGPLCCRAVRVHDAVVL
jgi:hypothetical protein